jgi:hypothetical protein
MKNELKNDLERVVNLLNNVNRCSLNIQQIQNNQNVLSNLRGEIQVYFKFLIFCFSNSLIIDLYNLFDQEKDGKSSIIKICKKIQNKNYSKDEYSKLSIDPEFLEIEKLLDKIEINDSLQILKDFRDKIVAHWDPDFDLKKQPLSRIQINELISLAVNIYYRITKKSVALEKPIDYNSENLIMDLIRIQTTVNIQK